MLTPDIPEPMIAMSTLDGRSGVERCVSSGLGSVRQKGVVDVGSGNVWLAGRCIGDMVVVVVEDDGFSLVVRFLNRIWLESLSQREMMASKSRNTNLLSPRFEDFESSGVGTCDVFILDNTYQLCFGLMTLLAFGFSHSYSGIASSDGSTGQKPPILAIAMPKKDRRLIIPTAQRSKSITSRRTFTNHGKGGLM